MNVYNLENIRKGDKAMQKRSKKQQNALVNSLLKAVIGMFFAVPELLRSQASPLQYRCKAH